MGEKYETESEYLASVDPCRVVLTAMDCAACHPTERRLRLAACAAARCAFDCWEPGDRTLLAGLESLCDLRRPGLSRVAVSCLKQVAVGRSLNAPRACCIADPVEALFTAASILRWPGFRGKSGVAGSVCCAVRCVMGSPWSPFAGIWTCSCGSRMLLDGSRRVCPLIRSESAEAPVWLSGRCASMAREIDEDTWDRAPGESDAAVLADALEDDGGPHWAIDHLRSLPVHYRGCHVLAMLTGEW